MGCDRYVRGLLLASQATCLIVLLGAASATFAQGDSPSVAAVPAGTQVCRSTEISKRGVGSQSRWRSKDSEWAKGNELAATAESHTSLVDDQVVYDYVNQIERKIVHDSQLEGCFVVKILKDAEFNAYSYPGGFIYVTSTLLLSAQNEDQLAAVLAHETAHVVARHVTTLDRESRNWRRIALFAGPAGFSLRHYLGPIVTMKLLRNQESEADRLGLQFFTRSGYDPDEFVRVLQIAFPDDYQPERFLDRIYNSHPPIKSRIKHLQVASHEFHFNTANHAPDNSEFALIQAQLQISIDTK